MQTFGGNKIKFTVGSSGDIDAIVGQIYRVQIRFVSNSVTAPSNIKSPDAVWLNKNLDYLILNYADDETLNKLKNFNAFPDNPGTF